MITIKPANPSAQTWVIGQWTTFELNNYKLPIDEMHTVHVRRSLYSGRGEGDSPSLDIVDASLVVKGEVPQILSIHTLYGVALMSEALVRQHVIEVIDATLAHAMRDG